MGKTKKNITEKARNNFFTMTCYTIVTMILILAYALETFSKHARSVPYFGIMCVLGLGPMVAQIILYKKNKESKALRHVLGLGFAAFYSYLLFTANSPLTFTYVILMLMAITVYNDKKFSGLFSVAAVVVNIVHAVLAAKNHSLGYEGVPEAQVMATAEIQIILMILVAFFSIYLARVLNLNSADKLKKIEEQQKNDEIRYNQTLEVVNKMTNDINDMYGKVADITETAAYTRNAMEEVSKGSADTSEAVQTQLIQTQNIQNNLTDADSAANTLTKEMRLTKGEIETGKVNMSDMVKSVSQSVKAGEKVSEQMADLEEKIKQMSSIVGIINGITSQTAMLSLNASIEAARAGEAGKGFSVVASEISSMATQTKEATVQITELIDGFSDVVMKVIAEVRSIVECVNHEKEITETTEKSFNDISNSSDIMSASIEKVAQIVADLVKSNVDIIDSIQTISGVSEEVSAHATETFDAEEDNVARLNEMSELMSDLKELTAKL